MTDNRVPAGVPTGGQFAASARAEADLSLDAPTETTQKAARDLAVGDRIEQGLITSREDRWGQVFVYVDGEVTDGTASGIYNHGDPVRVRPLDLTDPDEFETEVDRLTAIHVEPYEFVVSEEALAATREEIRRASVRMLTRISQPSNHSPITIDDPRAANGRAKVGDNVIWSSPMHGDSAYEVVGKRKAQTILGHDGDSVVWGESGDMEYVLRDIATGRETTSDLRQASWKRIPAPGDYGPAAERQRLERGQ